MKKNVNFVTKNVIKLTFSQRTVFLKKYLMILVIVLPFMSCKSSKELITKDTLFFPLPNSTFDVFCLSKHRSIFLIKSKENIVVERYAQHHGWIINNYNETMYPNIPNNGDTLFKGKNSVLRQKNGKIFYHNNKKYFRISSNLEHTSFDALNFYRNRHFIDSLVFSEQHDSLYNYRDLAESLPTSEFRALVLSKLDSLIRTFPSNKDTP